MGAQPAVDRGPHNGAVYALVQTTVEETIIDVVGHWYWEECQAGLDSTFAVDIELESMEVMEIAERLIDTYEGRVDFITWFSGMELDDLIELTIGDVVDFIVASLQDTDGAGDTNGTEGVESAETHTV